MHVQRYPSKDDCGISVVQVQCNQWTTPLIQDIQGVFSTLNIALDANSKWRDIHLKGSVVHTVGG